MESLQSLDLETMEAFGRLRSACPRQLENVMHDLSALGGQTVLTLVVIFAVGLLLSFRRYRTAAFVVATALGGYLLSVGLKVLVDRQRPPGGLIQVSGNSFPSGHSMLSAIIYLTLALIVSTVILRWRVRLYVIGSALVLVGLIGISRLYLGVHYLTDVAAGWLLGLAWAILCRWVEKRWVLRMERQAALINGNEP
jgi:undecaprenyl-diphosphatase